jgi:hypothetical protein
MCITATALSIGSLACIGAIMKSSDAYKIAVARARADPRVLTAIGSPLKEGWLITGNINVNNTSGRAEIAIPISGPQSKATIYVNASKAESEWHYSTLVVEIKNTRERIDLQENSPAEGPTHAEAP